MVRFGMLLDTLADQAAELDEIVDDNYDAYQARVRELVTNPDERDFDVWALYSDDVVVPLAAFASVPRKDKDLEWLERLAALLLAAQMQAMAEIVLRPALEVSEAHGERTNKQSLALDKAEIRKAAKAGISKEAVSTAAAKRRPKA
jgi:hypothetical protein